MSRHADDYWPLSAETKPSLPVGCRWLKTGEVIREGDIGFDGGLHIVNLGYIVGQKWSKKTWMPIARKKAL